MSEFSQFIRALDAFLSWPMVFFLGIVGFFVSVVVVKIYQRAEHEYFMASMQVRSWHHGLKQRAQQRKFQEKMRRIGCQAPVVIVPTGERLDFPGSAEPVLAKRLFPQKEIARARGVETSRDWDDEERRSMWFPNYPEPSFMGTCGLDSNSGYSGYYGSTR